MDVDRLIVVLTFDIGNETLGNLSIFAAGFRFILSVP